MNRILRFIWFFIRRQAQVRFLLGLKRKSVAAYLRAVQITRQLVILGILGFVVLQSVVIAGFAALVTGVWLLDFEPETKLTILFCVFVAMFTLPLLVLSQLLSEKRWYRASGAEKLVEDLQAK